MSLLLYWVALIDGKCCCVRTSMRITYVHKHIHIYTYSWMYYTISMIIHIYIDTYHLDVCIHTYIRIFFLLVRNEFSGRVSRPMAASSPAVKSPRSTRSRWRRTLKPPAIGKTFSQPGLRRQQIDLRQRQGKLEFIKHQIEEWWCFFLNLVTFLFFGFFFGDPCNHTVVKPLFWGACTDALTIITLEVPLNMNMSCFHPKMSRNSSPFRDLGVFTERSEAMKEGSLDALLAGIHMAIAFLACHGTT